MYKIKNADVIFYQRREIRRVTPYDIMLLIFGIYFLFIIFRNGISNSKMPSLFILTSYILAIFIAPFFLKKYNARITYSQLILDNVELASKAVSINSITDLACINDSTLKISGEEQNKKYTYNIHLDKEDVGKFIETINQRKEEYRNKVREEINNALKP